MAEALWTDVATAYDRSFAALCAGTAVPLLDWVPPGSRVLDVGCESGHVAAALVADGHVVHGVDPDPQMVALAASRSGADVRPGGLPDLPYAEASFDVVVANFVLNHVDDPREAAAGLLPVTRPGGHVVATVWPAYAPPQVILWNMLLDECGAVRPELPRLARDLDFERSPEGLGGLLTGAGLEVVEAITTAWDWRVRAEDLWAGLTSVGNFGVTWRAQSPEVRAAMRDAFGDVIAPWLDGEHLVFGVQAVLARGRAAGTTPGVPGGEAATHIGGEVDPGD